MTFEQLLQGAEILAQSGDPSITGVEYDSRRVKPGSVFVAMQGETSDGNSSSIRPSPPELWRLLRTPPARAPREGVAWAQVPHGRRALAKTER